MEKEKQFTTAVGEPIPDTPQTNPTSRSQVPVL